MSYLLFAYWDIQKNVFWSIGENWMQSILRVLHYIKQNKIDAHLWAAAVQNFYPLFADSDCRIT